MASTTNPLKNEHASTPNQVGQPGPAPAERVAEVTSSLRELVQDAASGITHAAEGAASYVGKKAGQATAAVGGGLTAAGSNVREHAPQGGMAGGASCAVADSLENTGRYLQTEGLTGVADEVTSLVRRYPIPAVLVGVGVGFLISRAATRWS
jgi:hypothetical protein